MEQKLSLSEKVELGLKMYGDEETGYEKWKSDLNTFLSDDFQKEWHSTDKSVFKKAARRLSIWQASSVFTFMFRGTWGDQFSTTRTDVLNFLKEAKSSAHVIDKRIEGLIDNVLNAAHAFEIEVEEDNNDDDDDDQKWSNELTNEVIKIAAIDISQFISQFSTILELQSNINNNDNEDNELFDEQIFDKLSFLYEFTTEGKIFPNMFKHFVVLDEINWLHDHQLDFELIYKLFVFCLFI